MVVSIGSVHSEYFDLPIQYQIGGNPWSIYSADFNGDGHPDVATVSYFVDSLTILTNNGDGTFTKTAKYPTGDHPVYVHGGDVNGDNAIDLITADKWDNTVSLFLNDSAGTFTAQTPIACGYHPSSVRLVDLDNDSFTDILVTNEQVTFPHVGDSISILYGNGDATFQSRVTFEVGDEPQQSVVADFDGNDTLDIAVVNINTGSLAVLLNDTARSYAAASFYESLDAPSDISTADLNNDTHLDLIAPNSSTFYGNGISVLLNKGNGTFDTTVYVHSGGYPFRTFVSDIDNDNDIDILVTNYKSDSISILLNNGDATFSEPIQYPTGNTPASIFIADFNNDSYYDLVVGNRDSDDILVYANRGIANGIDDNSVNGRPLIFELYQNAPNPFNPSTTIEYFLESRTWISLTIHNIPGQQVALLVDENQSAGMHRIQWDGTGSNGESLATGIYFYRLTGDNASITRKMILLK